MQKKFFLRSIFVLFLALVAVITLPFNSDPNPNSGFTSSAAPPSKLNWDIISRTGPQVYPSMIVVFSTVQFKEKAEPNALGAPLGLLGVYVVSPSDNASVKVVLTSPKLIHQSVYEGVLPKAGVKYKIYPHLKYDYDQLFKVRQIFPEDLSAEVFINGVSQGEKTKTMSIMSLNDCVFDLLKDDDEEDLSWMYAAYVNENHPLVEQILKEALKKDISSFAGYQGNADDVKAEINAIWQALQDRGIKYSSVSVPSVESEFVCCQHVRLLGDSLAGSQANCVDGTVLLASVLKKIGLNTYLVMNPSHMYLGVDLTEDGKNRIYIETTMIDDSDLGEAIEAGREQYNEDLKKKDEMMILNVDDAREMGVMPLKDVGNMAE
jgi:hypothetical protein